MSKLLIIFLLLWSFSSSGFSQTKTFVREYTYKAGEVDSKITARAISLDQVKRLLLEEVGVYIESSIETEKSENKSGLKELTKEQLLSVTAGVTETKVLDEKWTGETYYLKAEITLDIGDVLEKIRRIAQDRSKVKELEEIKQKADEAHNEIEKLRKQLTEVKDEIGKLKLQEQYKAQSDNLSATDWFQKGYNAEEVKDYDNAILYFQKAIKLDPRFVKGYVLMGLVYEDQGHLDKALEVLQRAIDLDTNNVISYFFQGEIYNKKSEYEKAIKSFQKIISLDPAFASAYNEMAIAYNYLGDYTKSFDLCKKAIEIDPKLFNAYGQLGFIYNQLKQPEKALASYQRVIELDPDNIEAYIGLGYTYVYGLKSNYEKAIALLSRAIEVDSNRSDAKFYLSHAYHMKGEQDKAAEDWFKKGNDAYQAKDFNDAIFCFQKAIDINPSYIEAYTSMGIAYGNKKNYDKAIELFQKAIELNPQYADAYYDLGIAYGKKGNNDKAIELVKKAAQLGSQSAQRLLEQSGQSWKR